MFCTTIIIVQICLNVYMFFFFISGLLLDICKMYNLQDNFIWNLHLCLLAGCQTTLKVWDQQSTAPFQLNAPCSCLLASCPCPPCCSCSWQMMGPAFPLSPLCKLPQAGPPQFALGVKHYKTTDERVGTYSSLFSSSLRPYQASSPAPPCPNQHLGKLQHNNNRSVSGHQLRGPTIAVKIQIINPGDQPYQGGDETWKTLQDHNNQ